MTRISWRYYCKQVGLINPYVSRSIIFWFFFPTCQVRVVRFYVSCPARLPPPPPPAPPPPPPDLNCKLVFAVVPAGPQLQARVRSGPCWTSTASDRSGPRRARTATSGSKWPLPDLDHKEPPKIYQIGCQKECQKICQILCICQKKCQKICQVECQEEEEERTTLMKSHQSCPLPLFAARKFCQKKC